MTISLQVYFATLQSTAGHWEDAQERLTGATKSLGEADVTLLGSRVAPAARAFTTTWSAELRRLEQRTGQHAQALRETAASFRAADQESVERTQTLLPFIDRGLTPTNALTPGSMQ